LRERERESKRADLKQLQRDLLRISVTTYAAAAAARVRVNANTPFVLLLHLPAID